MSSDESPGYDPLSGCPEKVSEKIRDDEDAYLPRWEERCGPPAYKRIICARCHQSKGVIKTHGKRRYCNDCQPLIAKTAGAAIGAVNTAIRRGELLPVSKCLCVDCGRQAEVYDHRQYAAATDVQPVCRSCNVKRGPATWGVPHIEKYFLEPAAL